MIARQHLAEIHDEADRRRLVKDAATVRRRSGLAQLFAWLPVRRATRGSEEGNAAAESKRLSHESGASDIAVARGDAS